MLSPARDDVSNVYDFVEAALLLAELFPEKQGGLLYHGLYVLEPRRRVLRGNRVETTDPLERYWELHGIVEAPFRGVLQDLRANRRNDDPAAGLGLVGQCYSDVVTTAAAMIEQEGQALFERLERIPHECALEYRMVCDASPKEGRFLGARPEPGRLETEILDAAIAELLAKLQDPAGLLKLFAVFADGVRVLRPDHSRALFLGIKYEWDRLESKAAPPPPAAAGGDAATTPHTPFEGLDLSELQKALLEYLQNQPRRTGDVEEMYEQFYPD